MKPNTTAVLLALVVAAVLHTLSVAHAAEPAATPVALKLAPIFADHMVLQREMPVPVWGTAKPGEKITVTFRDQKVSAVAGTNGEWRVKLASMPAVKEPQELTVAGDTTVVIKDVLVGEVWLGSGQSNMYLPVTAYTLGTQYALGVTVHGFGGCSVRCVEDHGACGKREGATPPRRKA